MSEVKDWIWFSKRQVLYFQDETEPKEFPDEYVKYIPKSAYDQVCKERDELKEQAKPLFWVALSKNLGEKLDLAIEALEFYVDEFDEIDNVHAREILAQIRGEKC